MKGSFWPMGRSDRTDLGGMSSRFPQTRWSLILSARTRDEVRSQLAMENLTHTYWKPIYCYLRRHGYGNEEAKDLTQDFFCAFMLEGKLVQSADKRVGRFRQLLMTALKRFVSNIERDKRRQKRAPKGRIIPLSALELACIDAPASEVAPDEAFYYAWITDLLDYALAETKRQCNEAGLGIHWQVFHRKVLAPILEDAVDTPLKLICREHSINSESLATNMMVTVKRRFRKVLQRRLRDLTRSDVQAEAEFQEIMAFLTQGGAGM